MDRKTENFVDKIKDAIDRLQGIKKPKLRLEAARDLIEYIELHYVEQHYIEAGR